MPVGSAEAHCPFAGEEEVVVVVLVEDMASDIVDGCLHEIMSTSGRRRSATSFAGHRCFLVVARISKVEAHSTR